MKNPKNLSHIIRGCVILSLLFLILFLYNQEYCLKCPIATDIVGQYGDFIGGVVGTILSVFLLYHTLKSQIEEFKNSASVFTKQHVNDVFFHLLQQYNSIIDSLSIITTDDINENLKGKEVLHYSLLQLQNEFDASHENQGRKRAIGLYMNFYSSLKDSIPTYFRTLYRIMDLVDSADIEEKEKVKYIKILRSQLTDTEVILLRYNAMTVLGKNARKYIVKYNLLKHTSPLGLLEYRQWRNLFVETTRNKVNIILYTVRKYIHKLINENVGTLAYTSTKAKYNINVSKLNEGRKIKVDFNRRVNIIISSYDDFFCFETVPLNVLAELFDNWMKEIFVFSNFGIINGIITTKIECIPMNNNQEHFSILVGSKNNQPLKA